MPTITLSDGPHDVSAPTFYALQLMEDNGLDIMGNLVINVRSVAVIISALLTDSEPFENGKPVRVWSPDEVAKLIPAGEAIAITEQATKMLTDSFPDASDKKAGKAVRPQ